MTDINVTDIKAIPLPYNKQLSLKNLEYNNGLNVLRLLIKEGTRFTTLDLDTVSAATLGADLVAWANDATAKLES